MADIVNSPVVAIYDDLKRATTPRAPFLVGAQTLTYGRLFDQVSRLAALFRRLGLGFGDRVAIVSAEDHAVIPIFIASLRCGLTAALLDPGAAPEELASLLESLGPKLAFIDSAILARVMAEADILAAINLVEITARGCSVASIFRDLAGRRDAGGALRFPALLRGPAPENRLPDTIPESLAAVILFTSGRTGPAKRVEITHRGLFSSLATLIRHYRFDAVLRLLNLFPLHQSTGLIHGAAVAFAAGGSLIRPFAGDIARATQMLGAVYRHRVSHVVAAPPLLAAMLASGKDHRDALATKEFKCVISTGAPLEPGLWNEFEHFFSTTVANAYGLTEATCQAIYCGPDAETRRVGSIGKPIDCEAKILDRDGQEVGSGVVGELALRGDTVMNGHSDKTAAGTKGWLLSGDLALRDADGFFHIVGRKPEAAAIHAKPAAAGKWGEAEIRHRVIAAAARILNISPELLSGEANPETIEGWNSLAHVELLLELEREFDLQFLPKEVMLIHGLGDAVTLIGTKLGTPRPERASAALRPPAMPEIALAPSPPSPPQPLGG